MPIIMGILFVGVWIRTRKIIYPTILMDIVLAAWAWDQMPGQAQTIIYGLNALVFGLIIYRLVTPVMGE
jgi:hypothetical protein